MTSHLLPFASMDSRQIRRENLTRLIAQYGTIEALASAANASAKYLSQIKNDTRGMGARTARKLEASLGLPAGWFDVTQSQQAKADPIPVELALFRRLSRKQREAITLILRSMVRD